MGPGCMVGVGQGKPTRLVVGMEGCSKGISGAETISSSNYLILRRLKELLSS